jgi:hypothetical protein
MDVVKEKLETRHELGSWTLLTSGFQAFDFYTFFQGSSAYSIDVYYIKFWSIYMMLSEHIYV